MSVKDIYILHPQKQYFNTRKGVPVPKNTLNKGVTFLMDVKIR